MKKWYEWTLIMSLSLFAYLGTGYQLATYMWDVTHSKDGIQFLTKTDSKSGALGRVIAETLWPLTFRMDGVEVDEEGKLRDSFRRKDNLLTPVIYKDRGSYVRSTMFLWGLKLIWNLISYLLILVANLVTWAILIIRSFIKFVLVLVFTPFGINI